MTASVTSRHLTPDMLPGFQYPAAPPHIEQAQGTSLLTAALVGGGAAGTVGLAGVGLLAARGRGHAIPSTLGHVAGSTWLKLGAAALGVGALVGAAVFLNGRASEQYMVHLAHQPDFSAAHDPTSVSAAIQQNWSQHAPPVENELARLKGAGIVEEYEGFPAGGGFIVKLHHSEAEELKSRMMYVPDAGLIEKLDE